MGNIFTSAPGYAGYFGPMKGGKALLGFARGSNAESDAYNNLSKMDSNWGFLTEGYTVQFGRSVQIKYFLNTALPAALTGYAQGTLQVTGLVGTYKAFQNLIGNGTGNSNIYEDICNPLTCVIANGTSFTACKDAGVQGTGDAGIDFICSGLILSTIQITGQVTQDGTLFQQGTLNFAMSGLKTKEATNASGGTVAMRTPAQTASRVATTA